MTDDEFPNRHPRTADGRYFVVDGCLWRCTNPDLDPNAKDALVHLLMMARRAVGFAKRSGDLTAEKTARRAVDIAKHALGERGPVWWTDGSPDYNRRLAQNSPSADWFTAMPHHLAE